MNRNLEQAFAEQAGQLFTKCRAYIGIDEDMPPEAKEALKEEIAAAWEALDVDFNRLFEEIADNLEEPMSEQQRERYCFSLITPFKEFSSVLYPYGEIGQDREYLETVQGVSDYEERVKRIEKQIAAAQARADRWFDKCFGADGIKATDEAKAVCFELAQLIKGYGIVLDAAFVVNGIDLKRMQERCGVWIISFPRLCRAWEIGEFIGSEALALEYLNKLPQEQPQGVTNIDTLAGVAPEPQQGEQGLKDLLPEKLKNDEAVVSIFQKGIDANLIEKKNNGLCWKDAKQLLAYFAEKISNRFSLTNRVDKDGNKTTDWKTFETIFNITGLKDAKQNWMRLNTRFEPTGYEKVDALM